MQYCNGEAFRPRCSDGSGNIVVVLSGRYGRMSFGRCLEPDPELQSMMNDPKFVGCSEDVKHILDDECSGQPMCDVRVNNQNFPGVRPCYAGMQMFLEATYACIQGTCHRVGGKKDIGLSTVKPGCIGYCLIFFA